MKVVAYARVSSDSQDKDLSISAQLRAVREYAAKHGQEIVSEFVDEAESGRSASRPAFHEMIALAKTKAPPFEGILVWKLNRFARNRVDSITYKALLRSKGIKVISVNEPLDDTPSGQLLEGVIESIDEFYSANLGQDVKRGMRENARRGFFSGSRPPPGLHKVAVQDGPKTRYRLEPDPDDSVAIKMVRRMFGLAFQDAGCKEIAKVMNTEGFRTANGRLWGKTTVHKILTNEAYCGTLVWGGRPGHPAIHSADPPVRVENAWPAIIDPAIFAVVQEKMAAKRPRVIHPRTIPSRYLLSGLLFCSCGHAMIGRSAKSHQYFYYTCNGGFKKGRDVCSARALPKDKLEQMVIEQVKHRILNQESLEELVGLVNMELDSTHDIVREKQDTIDAELNDVEIRLSKLYDALETEKLSLDDLAPRIKELRVRRDELSKAGLLVEAEKVTRIVKHVDAEIVKAYARDLECLFRKTDLLESKAFLRSFIKRIEIDGDSAKIDYVLPMPPDGRMREPVGVLPMVNSGGEGGTRTPTLFTAHDPKSCSSANSDTSPDRKPLHTIAFYGSSLKSSPEEVRKSRTASGYCLFDRE
jgi:site-specific DNA recombinase